MLALYVHVPFCARVCHYCDFAVLRAPARLHREYVDLVLREIALRAPTGLQGVRTAYLGGGTPSALDSRLLTALCNELRGLGLGDLTEFSMEFNPEQVGPEIIAAALAGGVDRYSLGLQSLDDVQLQRLGRTHNAQEGLAAWDQLRSASFRTGSVDLMFNLPGQTLPDFLRDVGKVVERRPDHVSFYGLTVEKQTLLGQQVQRGEAVIEEDLYGEMYKGAIALLSKAGLERYEVSNCARPGHESRHNSVYWRRESYLGVGPGAHSYLSGVRLAGPKTYARWREWVLAECPDSGLERDELDRSARMTEALWLSLRCRSGLDRSQFASEFGLELPEDILERYIKLGWLSSAKGVLSLQGEGWLYMDSVVTDLQARLESRPYKSECSQ